MKRKISYNAQKNTQKLGNFFKTKEEPKSEEDTNDKIEH